MSDAIPEICHLFVFLDTPETAISQMSALGFQESYRRVHHGQGTQNVCYCFDNCYLELLWVSRPEELQNPNVNVLKFDQRSNWLQNKASPFGIALRDNQTFPFPAYSYRAPYLPDGMTIPYAKSSDNLDYPFLFKSPGSIRPDQWESKPKRQTQSEIGTISLTFPEEVPIHKDFKLLEKEALIQLKTGQSHQMELTLRDSAGNDISILSLPDLTLKKIKKT